MSCYGNSKNPICTKCFDGYYLSNNACISPCNLGANSDYCKTCDILNPENCGSCHDGYYLSTNNKKKCNYCGSHKIKKCHEENNNIIVDECNPNYIKLKNSCVEKCNSINY